MRLKPDSAMRKAWFVADAMSHPAKGHLGMWWEIFEKYTQPGQWVLDPMAGIGSSLIGAMMGRNIICNEMETHFVVPMLASWHKMRQQVMLGCTLGEVVIIQGDARCLPLASADMVVTSPPWEDVQPNCRVGQTDFSGIGGIRHKEAGYTRPAAVVTSPPYEGTQLTPTAGTIEDMAYYTKKFGWNFGPSMNQGYTRPAAVVNSPPYENSELPREEHDSTRADGIHERYRYAERKSQNIGNMKGEKYWEAMRQVYTECRRVLPVGALMILVVKGFTRDHKYVDLPQQTADECVQLGFELIERWERELWNLSFWRTLQKNKNPEAWDKRLMFETVLVLRKV